LQLTTPDIDAQQANLAAISVSQVGIGSIETGELVVDASVDRIDGSPVTSRAFTLPSFSMPSVSTPENASQAPFNVASNLATQGISMNAGMLLLGITVRPPAVSHIDPVHITNLKASANV
jgi:hypothetical protein